MKKRVKVLTLLAMVIFLVSSSLTGCSNGDQNAAVEETSTVEETTQQEAASTQPVEPEKVTLKLYIPGPGYPLNDGVQDDPVSKEIERATGITIDLDGHPDDSKFNAMLASGDLPDLLMVSGTAAEQPSSIVKTMIENDMILPMDDLIKNFGPNIAKQEKMLAFCRDLFSNGTGKQYVMQGFIDPPPVKGYDSGLGPLLRWDYYAELGFPKINGTDDLIKVVGDMLAKHPTTDDGKPRYGFTQIVSWGIYGSFSPMGDICKAFEGKSVVSGRGGHMEYDMDNDSIRSSVMDEDSALWEGVELYYKAVKNNLLDPDAVTNKWDNLAQKCNADRILCFWFDWTFNEINAKLAPDGKGYAIIPMNSKGFVEGTASPLGVNFRLWTMPKKCSNPEAAMRLLDYFYSVEGARTVHSGLLGTHYVQKDNKFIIPKTVSDQQKADANFNVNNGIGKYSNAAGLGINYTDTASNQKVNLWGDPLAFEVPVEMNPFQKAYCEHYGISNFAEKYAYLEEYTFDGTISSLMAVTPEEIKAIDADIEQYLAVEMTKLMYAKDDKEFNDGKMRILQECLNKDIQKSIEWWTKTWYGAINKAKQFN